LLTRYTMKGVYAIVPTAFKKNGELDEENYRRNIRILCDAGFHGIFSLGSIGEFPHVGLSDFKRIVKIFVDEVKEGVVSIIGASAVNTEEAIIRAKYAQDCGVDAVMNVVPFYYTLQQKECVKYFRDLAEACPDIGILAYDNGYTTKVWLSYETYKELAKIPNFCGCKDINPNMLRYMSLIMDTDLQLWATEEKLIPSMLYGARGFFLSFYWNNPKLSLELYEACKNGEWKRAIEIERRLLTVITHPRSPWKVFGGKYDSHAITKALVNAIGLVHVGPPRRPLIPVSEEDQKAMRELLIEVCPDIFPEKPE